MPTNIRRKQFGDRVSTIGVTAEKKKGTGAPAPKGNVLTNAARAGKTVTVVSHQGEKAAASGQGPLGTQVEAHVQGPTLNVRAAGSAKATSFKSFDVDLRLNVDAKAVQAGASITKDIPFEFQGEKFNVRVRLAPDGFVGANGNLRITLKVGPDGVRAVLGADGFAGAKGALRGTIDLSMNGQQLAGGNAAITFAAGVGAGASFSGSPTNFEAKAYAVAGVGVGFELKGKVDPGNMAKALPKLLPDHVEARADRIWDDVSGRAGDVFEGARDAGGKVVSGGRNLVNRYNPFD